MYMNVFTSEECKMSLHIHEDVLTYTFFWKMSLHIHQDILQKNEEWLDIYGYRAIYLEIYMKASWYIHEDILHVCIHEDVYVFTYMRYFCLYIYMKTSTSSHTWDILHVYVYTCTYVNRDVYVIHISIVLCIFAYTWRCLDIYMKNVFTYTWRMSWHIHEECLYIYMKNVFTYTWRRLYIYMKNVFTNMYRAMDLGIYMSSIRQDACM